MRSRPLNTLVQEAESLAAAGVKELILVAQDTTAYGREQPGHPGLPALLRELAAIDGFRWIRLLYGHPARITPELLETMAANPRILPYLDLPIQHGHDEVLRRMGRGYTPPGYPGHGPPHPGDPPRGDAAHHGHGGLSRRDRGALPGPQ